MKSRLHHSGRVPGRYIAWAFHRLGGFTLIELLVVIAILAILATLLLPALAKTKEEGRRINCVSNLRQLQLCWQMYEQDYGMFCPNDWIDTTGGGYGSLGDMTSNSWCNGNARVDTNTTNIQLGLLFPYNHSTAIYHCPSDMSTIQDANGNPLPQPRTRSYNMSQSVNGYPTYVDPQSHYYVGALQPCFSKFSLVTNPVPARLFVFIDENEGTLEDDQFGYPAPNFYSGYWYDMPSNRHNQGGDLSFADGHVEYWHWKAPEINTTGPVVPVQPAQRPDYLRIGSAMRQVPVNWSTPPPGTVY